MLVGTYTELGHHVAYPLGGSSVVYLRVRENDPLGSGGTLQLIDIYRNSPGDVEQALLEGVDLADGLVDLLALAGYGAFSCQAGRDGPIAIKNRRIGTTATSNTLPQSMSGEATRTIFSGMSSLPQVDPLSLPPILR